MLHAKERDYSIGYPILHIENDSIKHLNDFLKSLQGPYFLGLFQDPTHFRTSLKIAP